MTEICNFRTWEVEAQNIISPQVQCQPGQHNETLSQNKTTLSPFQYLVKMMHIQMPWCSRREETNKETQLRQDLKIKVLKVSSQNFAMQ